MEKWCDCGKKLTIRLRTVIYQNRVEIENVPIYSCDVCKRTHVYPDIKKELKSLIGQLDNKPDKRHYYFDEMNEIARLINRISEEDFSRQSFESLIEERINELLDLLILAQSVDDILWAVDIRQRLAQISKYSMSV